MTRGGVRSGPGSGAGDEASAPGLEAGNRTQPVERREAQRFGGKASQAFRSSPARASGRVSHTRPNGGLAKPRSGKVRPVCGGNAGHTIGAP
jgi:hypothetical protein